MSEIFWTKSAFLVIGIALHEKTIHLKRYGKGFEVLHKISSTSNSNTESIFTVYKITALKITSKFKAKHLRYISFSSGCRQILFYFRTAIYQNMSSRLVPMLISLAHWLDVSNNGIVYPRNSYLFKVNNINSWKRCEMLTIQTLRLTPFECFYC